MKKIIFFFLLIAGAAQAQFAWKFQDRLFDPGDTLTADAWVSGFDSVGAFQFSLAYDSAALAIDLDTPFTFTGLTPWTAAEFSHGLQPGCTSADNEIRLVWADPYTFTYPNGKVFSIRFVAKKAGNICKSIWMLNGPLWPEAWDDDLLYQVPMSVGCIPARRTGIRIKSREDEQTAQVITITPNPFTDSFTINTSGPLRVTNIAGQVVLFGNYQSGQPLGESLSNGVYFGRVGNETFKIVKQ